MRIDRIRAPRLKLPNYLDTAYAHAVEAHARFRKGLPEKKKAGDDLRTLCRQTFGYARFKAGETVRYYRFYGNELDSSELAKHKVMHPKVANKIVSKYGMELLAVAAANAVLASETAAERLPQKEAQHSQKQQQVSRKTEALRAKEQAMRKKAQKAKAIDETEGVRPDKELLALQREEETLREEASFLRDTAENCRSGAPKIWEFARREFPEEYGEFVRLTDIARGQLEREKRQKVAEHARR